MSNKFIAFCLITIPILSIWIDAFAKLLKFESMIYFILAIIILNLDNIKKIKYKDIELELEKSDKNITKVLSRTEEDIKKIPEYLKYSTKEDGYLTELKNYPNVNIAIIDLWLKIENLLKEMSSEFLSMDTPKTAKDLISNLAKEKIIDKDLYKSLINFTQIRNKIMHCETTDYSIDILEQEFKIYKTLGMKKLIRQYAIQEANKR